MNTKENKEQEYNVTASWVESEGFTHGGAPMKSHESQRIAKINLNPRCITPKSVLKSMRQQDEYAPQVTPYQIRVESVDTSKKPDYYWFNDGTGWKEDDHFTMECETGTVSFPWYGDTPVWQGSLYWLVFKRLRCLEGDPYLGTFTIRKNGRPEKLIEGYVRESPRGEGGRVLRLTFLDLEAFHNASSLLDD